MWSYPNFIAHRGGGTLAPENTLAGFQCGLDWGFHAVEFDVMLTKDLVPVVIHDENLGRTVAGKGLVSATNWKDLAELDAGSWFSPKFAGSRVPLYVDVLQFCTRHGIWMNVEIKPASGFEEITGRVVGEMTRDFFQQSNFPTAPEPLFSSFDLSALRAAKSVAQNIPRAILFKRIPLKWRAHLAELEAVAVHTNHRNLSPKMAAKIKQAGVGLACYTVNDVARAHQLKLWGVDAFFTDRLDLDWRSLVD